MDSHSVFENKNGDLSRDALLCGYVQVKGAFKLHRGHNCYHVIGTDKEGTRHWFSTYLLKQARAKLTELNHKDKKKKA